MMPNFLVIFVLAVLKISTTLSQLPDPERTYLIQSSGDGMYMRGYGRGQDCVGLDSIRLRNIFSDPAPNEFRWKVVYNIQTGAVIIKSFINEEGYQLNTVSNKDEPLCNTPVREVELINEGNGSPFLIKSVGTNLCLSSFGSEVGVAVWVDCDFSGGIFRHWYFEGL